MCRNRLPPYCMSPNCSNTSQVLYHQGWYTAVEKAITGLKSSLLVEHPETNKLYVNMDPHVWELLRETKLMKLMKLDVSSAIQFGTSQIFNNVLDNRLQYSSI